MLQVVGKIINNQGFLAVMQNNELLDCDKVIEFYPASGVISVFSGLENDQISSFTGNKVDLMEKFIEIVWEYSKSLTFTDISVSLCL